MKDTLLSDLLRQANINTDNQLMDLSDSSWKDLPCTGRNIGSYIMFIMVVQLTMTYMLQDQLLNQVQKVSKIYHVLK